jgi:rod shape-determining protein MreC
MTNKVVSKKIFKFFFIGIVAIFLIAWNPHNFFNGIRSFFLGITLPIQKSFSLTAEKVYLFKEVIISIGKIKNENRQLIEENLKLKAESVRNTSIARENEELCKQLNIIPKGKFNLEASRIVARSGYDNNNWALIDKGKSNGIEKGMSVVVGESILVGKVGEVFRSTAKIVFINDKSVGVNVEAVETGAVGMVKGDYGLGLIMDVVLQTDNLKIGDKVVTSNISQEVPSGLLVGEIKEIDPAKNDLFQKAIIVSPVNFNELKFVFIIKGDKN